MASASVNDPQPTCSARPWRAAIGAAVALVVFPSVALAQPDGSSKAAAEVLFNDGKQLVAEGKFAEACPKFAESLRLDAGIGTMLYLADCYEKNGQLASAWAEFREAAATASAAGQAEREKKARERAAALEPRLSRLTIAVAPGASIAGLEIKRDGEAVGKPLWGTAVPLDAGEHVIEVSAPGKRSWSTRVTLGPQASAPVVVQVPVLQDDELAPTTPAPANAKEERHATPKAKRGAAQVVGFTALGLGVVGLGVGGALGVVAIGKNNDSNDPTGLRCRPNNVCSELGKQLRGQALSFAKGSTIAMIAGGALAAGGLITVLVARSGPSAARSSAALWVSPSFGAREGGLSVGGSF